MLKVNYTRERIVRTNRNYIIDNMVEPRFVNTGETDVIIDGIIVHPNDSFSCAFTNAQSFGKVSIVFPNLSERDKIEDPITKEQRFPIKEVYCFFGRQRLNDDC